ncbi:hypothetical protein HZC32_01630 [Candidatus Woesearchaeota archaeon]|nr:hypothetical protein [Candidatus Woesearchaeota archaeon]
MVDQPSPKLFFDTGPIISLIMSRLVRILPELKKKFDGKFYITPAVQRELVERPLLVKRFEFEALQALKLIHDGVLEVYEDVPKKICSQLLSLANNSFRIDNKAIDIIQSGEIESLACALELDAEGIVMDERTLRLLVENGSELKSLLEHRFKKEVSADLGLLKQFGQQLKGIPIIRSVELVAAAYHLGLLDEYIPSQRQGKEILLDSVLWATKFNGCAVTEEEIEEIKGVLLA